MLFTSHDRELADPHASRAFVAAFTGRRRQPRRKYERVGNSQAGGYIWLRLLPPKATPTQSV